MHHNEINYNPNMYLMQIYTCLAVMVGYASYHVGLMLMWLGEIITPDSLIGPGALTIGTVAALIWYVRRDVDRSKALNDQYEKRLAEKDEQIRRLQDNLDHFINKNI